MAKAEIRIGTSGFSYKEWLGGFYPEKLPATKMLEYYGCPPSSHMLACVL
jgi:uncharacterized protein YecE (DUF72 family)